MFLFSNRREKSRSGRSTMDSRRQQQQGAGPRPRPRLERRNAVKKVESETEEESWSSRLSAVSEEATDLLATRSLPSASAHQTSFRIGGSIEGEVDILCRSLGLSGPEDFAISVDDWERSKVRSSSDVLPRSRFLQLDIPTHEDIAFEPEDLTSASDSYPSERSLFSGDEQINHKDPEGETQQLTDGFKAVNNVSDTEPANPCAFPCSGGGEGGIRGLRPPVLSPPSPLMADFSPVLLKPMLNNPLSKLKPPPSMSRPAVDGSSSTWDIVRSFAPEESDLDAGRRRSVDSEENEDKERVIVGDEISEEELRELWPSETSEDFTGTSSYSTINDDESSSTTTETMFVISPIGRLKRKIKSWTRGVHLGSGSYGMVYEALTDDGVFFAVKEVSLLDQGSNAQQCIMQLEQEVTLLSHFEHENIVQYYGTDKEESKLYIFLELVTKGSLASLYQNYRLQDSQVSAYTRQILSGLKYLHERNVVHRDIKCANILVHASGSVKLADFGLAKEMTKFNMLKSCKGSVYWMAPEVVNPRKSYGTSADIWSLGCTVLELLTRQIPFPDLEWTQALFRIGRGEQPQIPASLSKDARDFISQCVKVSPDDRPTASQLLEHPFVKRSRPSGSMPSSFNNES